MLSGQKAVHRPRLRFLAGLGMVAALAAGLGLRSPMVASVGPLAVVIAAREWRRRQLRAAERELGVRLTAAVDQLIQQLRSGLSLRQGCERLGDSQIRDSQLGDSQLGSQPSPFGALSSRLRSGATLLEAARSLDQRNPASQLLSVTLQVLTTNGGPAVPALQRLRHTLIGVVQAGQQADAEASQAMASAGLLVAAPGVFAVAVAALDQNAARLYLFEPIGMGCVLASLTMSYVGWCWMQRVLTSALAAPR